MSIKNKINEKPSMDIITYINYVINEIYDSFNDYNCIITENKIDGEYKQVVIKFIKEE